MSARPDAYRRENPEPLAQTATAYLRRLSELMLSFEVTDGSGGELSLDEGADKAVETILAVGAASGKVMLVGNGGSAAIVSHVHNDLCKAVGVRALVFTEQPLLTALSNDHGYETAFERPVALWAERGDLIIAVSSSGRSESILGPVRTARQRGSRVITLSGFSPDNPLMAMGDLNFYLNSDIYGHVETGHAALLHYVTDRAASVRKSLAGRGASELVGSSPGS